ncbi:putative polysaccharide synthase Cps1 [Nemania sp. FL0916]|nr:putative polysaccharide synthase Cps1 [Nemania sp. FL0916]
MSLFWTLFAFRYLRTIVGVSVYTTIKPKPIQNPPTYSGKDVTVVIPTTFKCPPELIECLRSITASSPFEILIVTSNANVEILSSYAHEKGFTVTVLGVEKLNKREQILKALPNVATPITVLADDDVFWPVKFLDTLLAVFEDPKCGAGGPLQRVKRNTNPDVWNFLGIGYLERRVFNNLATNAIDGSISTLSGRTAAYRTEIIQTEEFATYFLNDNWNGRKVHIGDDKCLTRYVYNHGWNIVIQPDPRSTIETTVEPDMKGYLNQCMRWARGHWQGNIAVMKTTDYWYKRHIWGRGLYYIYIGQFQTPALLVDGLLFYTLSYALSNASWHTACLAYAALGSWIIFTKLVKLIPHFWKYPSDMKFIPHSIAFSYFHGIINLYSLWTLGAAGWGSQNLSELEKKRDITASKNAAQ